MQLAGTRARDHRGDHVGGLGTAEAAGLGYLQHIVALHAAVRDGDLVARPSFWQLTQTRKARAKGEPAHLVVHEDVLIFSAPGRLGAYA